MISKSTRFLPSRFQLPWIFLRKNSLYDLRHSTRFDPFFSSFFFPSRTPSSLAFNFQRRSLATQCTSLVVADSDKFLGSHNAHGCIAVALNAAFLSRLRFLLSLSLFFSCLRLSLSTLIPANSIDNAKNFSRLYFRVRRSPTGSLNGGLHRISCLYVLPLLFHENSSSPPILVLMIPRNRRAS